VWAEPDPDPKNKGGFVVMVAIADVASYVTPGSALDKEARVRGNSVYFPDRVVPMLPERISNDLCSLRAEEPRPCLAVRMVFDKDGRKKSHRFLRGIIRSAAALAYEQAADGGPPTVAIDWFYLPAYPLIDRWGGTAVWVASLGFLALLMLMPWLPPRRTPAPARVDLANCNGCARCFADCPFGAITMAPRSDGRSYQQEALVNADQCMACGICVGSCPTATPMRSAADFVAVVKAGSGRRRHNGLDPAPRFRDIAAARTAVDLPMNQTAEKPRERRIIYERQVEDEGTQIVRLYGDHTAIVTARLWLKGVRDERPIDVRLWFSDTYVRTPQGWRYAFGQASTALPTDK